MEKSVVDTKNIIVDNINNLFNELEHFSKELDVKYKNINEMKLDVDQKHQDINSFKKVSFIANMNKQLEEKNKLIQLLEKRISSLLKKNDKLNNQLKELNSNIIIESDEDSVKTINIKDEEEEDKEEDLEESNDIWQIKELEGNKYLFNSETKKIHVMNKNESPGNIIGRITSKDKFKKYNQPKEYC